MLLLCYSLLFIFMLLFTSSSSFIFCWMLMEAGTLSFLSIICLQNVNQKFMSISSYFLIQVFSSSLFLVSISFSVEGVLMKVLGLFMYNFALSMKIGLFPFHNWVVNLVYGFNWFSIGLLSTYQKFMPMVMLSMMIWYYYYLLIGFLTMLISLYFSFGLLSSKLIFSYSILSHSAWMSLMLLNMNYWMIYYSVYSMLFMMICLFNYYYNIDSLESFYSLSFSPRYMVFVYLLNIISLSGMPPFTGFLLKWLMLDYFSVNLVYIYLYMLIITSLVHFYMYMRLLIYGVFMFNGKSKPLITFFWQYTSTVWLMFTLSILVNLYILYLGLMMMD